MKSEPQIKKNTAKKLKEKEKEKQKVLYSKKATKMDISPGY